MKKRFSIFLLLILVFIISACGASSYTVPATIPTAPPPTNAPKPVATQTPTDGLKSDGKIHVYLIGKGEKINTPDSSFINYLVYYSSSKHLIICMNGKEYVFANVSSSLWSDFKSTDSVGEFYSKKIRGNSTFHINDYNGSNGDLIVFDYVD